MLFEGFTLFLLQGLNLRGGRRGLLLELIDSLTFSIVNLTPIVSVLVPGSGCRTLLNSIIIFIFAVKSARFVMI